MLAITVSAQARPVAKAQPKHTASGRPTGHPLRSVKLALPVTFATGKFSRMYGFLWPLAYTLVKPHAPRNELEGPAIANLPRRNLS